MCQASRKRSFNRSRYSRKLINLSSERSNMLSWTGAEIEIEIEIEIDIDNDRETSKTF